jgi:hypothetical protein
LAKQGLLGNSISAPSSAGSLSISTAKASSVSPAGGGVFAPLLPSR